MNLLGRASGCVRPRSGQQILIPLLSLALLFSTWPQKLSAYQDTLWLGKSRSLDGLRVGHDQRQTLGAALGARRRVGHAGHMTGHTQASTMQGRNDASTEAQTPVLEILTSVKPGYAA